MQRVFVVGKNKKSLDSYPMAKARELFSRVPAEVGGRYRSTIIFIYETQTELILYQYRRKIEPKSQQHLSRKVIWTTKRIDRLWYMGDALSWWMSRGRGQHEWKDGGPYCDQGFLKSWERDGWRSPRPGNIWKQMVTWRNHIKHRYRSEIAKIGQFAFRSQFQKKLAF